VFSAIDSALIFGRGKEPFLRGSCSLAWFIDGGEGR